MQRKSFVASSPHHRSAIYRQSLTHAWTSWNNEARQITLSAGACSCAASPSTSKSAPSISTTHSWRTQHAAPQANKRYTSIGPRQGSHACAAITGAADSGSQDQALGLPSIGAIGAFCHALWKFTRPHTMFGTAISVTSISLLAVQSGVGSGAALSVSAAVVGWALAMVSALLANIAIVGTNQLSDVDIDKVNKPYLPLASGEFSMATGAAIVGVCTVASIAVGMYSGSAPLLATLLISLVLGTLYSVELPFMRWKRSPFLAAGCILVVRALLVQLGFFAHMQQAVGAAATGFVLTPSIAFTVGFMMLFSVVIALFKDIPDVRGDQRAGVQTFTVRMGIPRVFWACIWILTAAYGAAVVYALSSAWVAITASTGAAAAAGTMSSVVGAAAAVATGLSAAVPASMSLGAAPAAGTAGTAAIVGVAVRTAACVGGHAALAASLWGRAQATDLRNHNDITACYMHVWKLFYAEYLLIPLLL